MKRFALYSRLPIELAPLQVYRSALVFAPMNSLVKRQFADQLTQWIKSPPQVDNDWSVCLQTLEGHSTDVISVVFSHDSTRLASLSYRNTKIWDVGSGECLNTFDVLNILNYPVAFSHDLTRVVLTCGDSAVIRIWDLSNHAHLHTLDGYRDVELVSFSHDSTRLAIVSRDGAIKIWDADSGVCLYTPKIHTYNFNSRTFSHDLMQLALGSQNGTIKICDASSGICLQTLEDRLNSVVSVAFSQNAVWLASVSIDCTAKVWDISSGACLYALKGHNNYIRLVTFSHDSMRLASASENGTIKVWDTSNGACLQTYEGHSSRIYSVAFSHDSTQLASASRDQTVKIWDTSSSACLQTHEDHEDNLSSVALSLDPKQQLLDTTNCTCRELESFGRFFCDTRLTNFPDGFRWRTCGLVNGTIEIEDSESGTLLKKFEGHRGNIQQLTLSHDLTRLASASQDKTIKIWDISSGACLQTLKNNHLYRVSSMAFSCDLVLLALAESNGAVRIWDISSGACLRTFENRCRISNDMAFSDGLTVLLSKSVDNTVNMWDANSGTRLQTIGSCKNLPSAEEFVLSHWEDTVTSQPIIHCSISVSEDGTWISYNGQQQLWLPVEYRPGHFIISGGCITVTTVLGRTWRCQFV
jgi:WD40 repeat protein